MAAKRPLKSQIQVGGLIVLLIGLVYTVPISADTGNNFVGVSPYRLVDTRASFGKVGSGAGGGSPLTVTVAGQGGLPPVGISGVSLNVTVVSGEAPPEGGFVTVYPCGTLPNSSNLNFVNGQTVPNAVIAPVNSFGQVCFYVYGRAHIIADVNGYFSADDGSGSDFYSVDTGDMFALPGTYRTGTLFCPIGTVAVGTANSIYGFISGMFMFATSALYFLTNDTSISATGMSAQLTCATTASSTFSDLNVVRVESGESDEASRKLEELESQAKAHGLQPYVEPGLIDG